MFHCPNCCPVKNNLLVPNDIIDMKHWYLTLPLKRSNREDAKIIYNPDLQTFQDMQFFKVSQARNSVLFTAHVGGATTKGSHYPRSELREMDGPDRDNKALWSSRKGYHEMRTVLSINEIPKVKQDVVALQIHDGKSDVMQVLVKKKRLYVRGGVGSKTVDYGSLDDNYILGTMFTAKIVCTEGRVKVFFNDSPTPKLDFAYAGDNKNYFKVGAYVQSNPSKGDDPDTVGIVQVFSCEVKHLYFL